MSIHVEWDSDDRRVINFIMQDPWDWTQFYTAIDQTKKLAQTTTLDVCLIVDLSKTSSMPPSAISHYKHMAEMLDDYIDLAVVANGNRFYGTMFTMFKKLTRGPIADSYYWASTTEEAHKIIGENRQSLK